MPHIEKRIGKSGRSRFTATVRVKGYPTKCATFSKHGDARDWAQALEADMRSGRYGGDTMARKHTVADMIRRYVQHVLDSKSDRANYVESQRRQLEWWLGEIGDYKLIHLQPMLMSEAKDKLAGHNYSLRKPATVNRYFSALNHVINTAIREWGWLHTNPIGKITRPKEPQGRIRYLTEDEVTRLLDACRAEKWLPLYAIVVFALSTGARKGEILSLKIKDVDYKRMIAVAHDTKNGEPRTLYLSPYVCDLLKQQHMRALLTPQSKTIKRNKGLMFVSRAGQPLNIEYAWRKALKRAGISNFRFHDLRHTAASYLAMNGATPSEIGEVLGHKSYDMVKRYSHLSTTHVGNVVRGMNEKLIGQLQQGAGV